MFCFFFFPMNKCWILSNNFLKSIEMIIWFFGEYVNYINYFLLISLTFIGSIYISIRFLCNLFVEKMGSLCCKFFPVGTYWVYSHCKLKVGTKSGSEQDQMVWGRLPLGWQVFSIRRYIMTGCIFLF